MPTLLWLSVDSSYSHSSLALPLVQLACRDRAGWRWLRHDALNGDDPGEAAARIAGARPDAVACTLYLFNRGSALDILARVKALLPGVRLLAGGPECLGEGAAELLRSHPFLDAACGGEGEVSMPPILDALERGASPAGIPGVCVRDRRIGAVVPAALPSPEHEGWAEAPLPTESPFFPDGRPFVQLETSRGCGQGCLYCTSGGVRARYRAPDRVREELAEVRRRGVREVRLLDRTFNVPEGRAAELLRMFRSEFPDIRFHLEVHPRFLGPEVREELRRALPGQLFVEAGLQSLAPEVRRAVGRGGDPGADLEGLAFLCACGAFETHVDLISGLPEQTLDGILQDVDRLLAIGPAEIQLETLKVLPGTPLRATAPALGIVSSPVPPYDVMLTRTMGAGDILAARALSRVLDRFHNHPALREVFAAAARERPGAVRELLRVCRERGFAGGRGPGLRSRFVLLDGLYAEDRHPRAREALAFAWLKAGFPPGESPAAQAVPCREVPGDAVLLEGDAGVLAKRGTRLFVLPCRDRRRYFAFNRARTMNGPAAILQEG